LPAAGTAIGLQVIARSSYSAEDFYRLRLQWHFLLDPSFFQAKRVKSAAKIKPGLVVGFAKDFRHNSVVRTSLPQPLALIPFPFARCLALKFAFFFPFFF